ncbi:MAG TPA: chloride channel protein, partial [Motilibacteraceae bacterium]|nr:chloride channel protein [Motilibacteraceae bacterium]
HLPAFTIAHPGEYLLYALLGLLAGVVGVLFTRVLYAVEDVCDWVWRGPEWARPAVGGLVLGLLLLVLPQLYGVGYPVLQAGVEGRYALAFLVVLLLGKMLATSLTIGIGGSGGVFAPSLFIGAMFGAAFGDVVHVLAPGLAGPTGAYALVGMGAVFAGSARAPITAVLIMFELTGEYTIILPLMLAIVLATAVSHRLSADTVYTLKLRRRGVDLDAPAGDPRLRTVRVADVMVQPPAALPADLHLPAAARAVLASGRPAVPVSRDGTLLGVVTARAVSEALADDAEAPAHEVGSLASMPEVLHPDDPLSTALQVLVTADAGGAPVLDREHRMVGWLTHASVLHVLTRDVAGGPRGAVASSTGTGPSVDLTDDPPPPQPVRRGRVPGPV